MADGGAFTVADGGGAGGSPPWGDGGSTGGSPPWGNSAFEAPMRLALAEAAAAAGEGEVPVGAVILGPAGEVVARGRNQREARSDPTAHAEIVAIRAAARLAGSWRLDGYTLLVTLEPCTMCAGAISAARIGRLVYAAADPRAGAVGSLWDVIRDPRVAPWPEVIAGVLGDEGLEVIQTFFSERR